MKKQTMITISACVLAAAGTATAQDSDGTNMPVVSSAPPGVEFTPMTRSERVREYVKGTFWPGSFVTAAARAGIDQAFDRPKEWGGADGFGKRLGNVYGKHVIRQTLQFGASAALHEDDRYLASGQKGFWSRTRYAIASTFLARRDNGVRCFCVGSHGGRRRFGVHFARVAAGQHVGNGKRREQLRVHDCRRPGIQHRQGILA